jgi:hypothetical protein
MGLRLPAHADANDRRAEEPSLVKSAERTVRILEALAASPSRLTLSDTRGRACTRWCARCAS